MIVAQPASELRGGGGRRRSATDSRAKKLEEGDRLTFRQQFLLWDSLIKKRCFGGARHLETAIMDWAEVVKLSWNIMGSGSRTDGPEVILGAHTNQKLKDIPTN